MNESLEVPNLDEMNAILSATLLADISIHAHRYNEFHALLLIDELVYIEGLIVNLELILHLQAFRQVKVLSHVHILLSRSLLPDPQKQKEHI